MAARAKLEDRWTAVNSGVTGFRIHSLCSSDEPGNDPPVVFVPGLAAPGLSMVPTAELLPAERRVLIVDLPEHADKGRSDPCLALSQYAAITAGWAETFGIERAVWVGHSFGAQVVAELAATRPGLVDRLVLVSPTVNPEARSLPSQAARLLLDATREPRSLLRVLFRDYRNAGVRRLLEIGREAVADRIEEKLPSIEAPTLVVYGDRDPLVPKRWAKQIVSLLPNGKLVVIRGAPHAVQYACPEALARELLAFLDEPVAEGAQAASAPDPLV